FVWALGHRRRRLLMSLIAGFQPDDFRIDVKAQKARKWSLKYYHKNRNRINAKRKAKTVYVCSCGETFQGQGRWQTARKHAKETKHTMKQAGRRVTWP
ncbi:MAG: hypothetical protein ABI348_11035, partial [Nitrososphaera sp.]